jgi:hypothetical protein
MTSHLAVLHLASRADHKQVTLSIGQVLLKSLVLPQFSHLVHIHHLAVSHIDYNLVPILTWASLHPRHIQYSGHVVSLLLPPDIVCLAYLRPFKLQSFISQLDLPTALNDLDNPYPFLCKSGTCS